MVGSYSSTKWFWMSWMVNALFPTPPAPTTTSLYSVIALPAAQCGARSRLPRPAPAPPPRLTAPAPRTRNTLLQSFRLPVPARRHHPVPEVRQLRPGTWPRQMPADRRRVGVGWGGGRRRPTTRERRARREALFKISKTLFYFHSLPLTEKIGESNVCFTKIMHLPEKKTLNWE